MNIGISYDLRTDYPELGIDSEQTAEFDVPETIDAIFDALTRLGFSPVRIGGFRKLAARLVEGERFDAVFNICEGLKGHAREAQVPALLEAYDIPYVFSDPLTLALALDKSMAKRVVRDGQVKTADFVVVEDVAALENCRLEFPLFVKPCSEGSGKGIDQDSKVDDGRSLSRATARLLKRFGQPVLVEEYLPGREFTVGITGTGQDASVLGVTEIVRTERFVGAGYGYENKEKWEDKVIIRLCDDAAARAAAEVALGAWRVLRCRDGGRVDIRNDKFDQANFVEVNPLAGLRPEYSDLCFIANFQKISYDELIGMIMESFLKRNPQLREPQRSAA